MRFLSRVALLAALLRAAPGQLSLVPDNGGAGSDGSFVAVGTVVLDSSIQNLYQYTSFTIPAGTTVVCRGPTPIVIRVQGAVQIDGTLSASGDPGIAGGNNLAGGSGGVAGAGAGIGGDGGAHPLVPFNGTGLPGGGVSPGQPGYDTAAAFTDPVGGGGGGGNAVAGVSGGPPNNTTTTLNSSGAGGLAVFPCHAGSGGGGGAGDIDSTTTAAQNDGGGGGGGGGGWVTLTTNGTLTIGPGGAIRANGGLGGTSSGNGGGGGGGSGGLIALAAPTIVNLGAISSVGGAGGPATQAGCGCSPGGPGGDGCVNLLTDNLVNSGTITPTPNQGSHSLVLTGVSSAGRLLVTAPSTGDPYLVLGAFFLAPSPIPTPFGPFLLDLTDPLLILLFPQNQLPSVVGPISGLGSGGVTIDLSSITLAPGTAATISFQALSGSTFLTGLSPRVEVRVDA